MPTVAQSSAPAVTFDSLSTAAKASVKALRRPVLDFAAKFAVVREKVKDIAPRVMKAFKTLQAAHAELTFVDFCRMIDPSIPTTAADKDGQIGYRNHKTYYSLNYMRQQENLGNRRGRTGGTQGSRNNATDGLARTLATVLQVLPASSHPAVWQAVADELAFGERIMNRLKKRVSDTKPLLKLTAARVSVGNVIHMAAPASTETATAAGTETATQGRRRAA